MGHSLLILEILLYQSLFLPHTTHLCLFENKQVLPVQS